MASRNWVAIKEVFAAALPLPPAQREAYLASVAAESGDIALAVRDLLRAHEEASTSFLEPGSIALRPTWLFHEHDKVGGRFQIKRPIARGAMGEVYEAYDQRLRLPLALKAIRPELLADPETVERFRREVLVTRNISHANVCRVFDLVEHALPPQADFPEGLTLPCLTMELLEGTSLEDWLTERRPVPMQDALDLVTQIAAALQTLHDSGIVHRDLKPSNVVIVRNGNRTRAVLTDFGLARPVEPGLFETQTAVHGGAPYFMAPELFRGERPSPASDIYALGLLIDELVTERRAFSATSLHGLLLQKLGEGPERASARAPGLSRTWDQVIARCLDPDPARRIPSASQVVNRLKARPHTWEAARWPLRHRDLTFRLTPRRWWRMAGYSTLSAVLLGGLGLNEALRSRPPEFVVVAGFTNATGEPDLDYLAKGTAAHVSQRLSALPGFQVVTAPTPDQLRLTTDRPRYSVAGEIRLRQGMLDVIVRIGDMEQDRTVWTETISAPRDDVLALGERLSDSALEALEAMRARTPVETVAHAASLFGWDAESPARVVERGTTSSAAFDAYLRGCSLFEERTLASALRARPYLIRAAEIDPTFAEPHAVLADVHGVLMDLRYGPHDVLLAEAERHALHAVELGPDLAAAHLSLAAVRQMQWEWTEADVAYRRAIELHPTLGRAHRWYGGLLLQFGRFEEALERYRYAVQIDPFDNPSQSALGHALFYAGRPGEAAAHLERLLAHSDVYYARAVLGQVYAYLGGTEASGSRTLLRKALAQADHLRQHDVASGVPTMYADLIAAMAWSYQGNVEATEPYLNRLQHARESGPASPGLLARVYAARGDAPAAMAALLEAEVRRDRELLYLKVSPIYEGLRNEPEFQALMRRVGLVE